MRSTAFLQLIINVIVTLICQILVILQRVGGVVAASANRCGAWSLVTVRGNVETCTAELHLERSSNDVDFWDNRAHGRERSWRARGMAVCVHGAREEW